MRALRHRRRRTSLTRRLVRGGAVFLIGVVAGAMVEEYLVLDVVLRGLPAEQWVLVHSRFSRAHLVTVPAAIVGMLLILCTFIVDDDTRTPRARLTWGAAAAGVMIGLLTVVVMMPMNRMIAGWATYGLPAGFADVQDRWILLQGMRALLSVSGFALLVASVFARGPDDPQPSDPGRRSDPAVRFILP